MSMKKGAAFVSILSALVITAFVFTAGRATQAQDDTPVACDSTLALLLFIAEHEFDYLSSMVDSEMGMPNVDYGQYDLIINETIGMMLEMMSDMTEEQMASREAMQELVAPLLEKEDANAILEDYAMSMSMENMGTILPPGSLPGEPDLCTTVRADVERFLLAHFIAESQMMMAEGM